MARIAYEGDNKFQLFEFIRRLLEQDVSFQVDFEEGRTHWYLTGMGPTAVGGRDADILKKAWHAVQYKKLKIIAADPSTQIYLSDEDGALVQTEVGKMNTSIMGGRYYIEFGLEADKVPLNLNEDTEVHENEPADHRQ